MILDFGRNDSLFKIFCSQKLFRELKKCIICGHEAGVAPKLESTVVSSAAAIANTEFLQKIFYETASDHADSTHWRIKIHGHGKNIDLQKIP
ncbi:MAG: hypothetical protein LBF57_01975 [Holosporaceae bacterium]|jgi:hypothetical protein|nr:hypothetical protein [Holosporaceae bacterium]